MTAHFQFRNVHIFVWLHKEEFDFLPVVRINWKKAGKTLNLGLWWFTVQFTTDSDLTRIMALKFEILPSILDMKISRIGVARQVREPTKYW